jgi:condensin complex subunit 3
MLITTIHTPIIMVNARPRASSASYLQSLPFLLGPIFDQVQNTVANHRKNLVSLRNIQEQCSNITEVGPRGARAIGEKAFNAMFIDMVNRILPVKKGVAVADRAVKFVASYVAYTTEQGQWLLGSGEWMLIDRPGVSSGR